MTGWLFPVLAFLLLAAPAHAHKLKVFATVEGTTVKGYAFFIGGGRAVNTPWIASSAGGNEIAAGATDADGRFTFEAPQDASDVTITVDTREGHIASAALPAMRFGVGQSAGGDRDAVVSAGPLPSGSGPALQDKKIAQLVEGAVQRQLEPVMERIEQMDARLRFTDMVSGVFLILGLAGMGLWVVGRRR